MHALLLVALALQQAPDTLLVQPGDPGVRGASISPYEVTWVQYFETGERRALRRTIVDRVEREMTEGSSTLVRTQIFLDRDGEPTSQRVNRIDGETLIPLKERWTFRGRVTHVDYEGGRVSGAMIDEPAREPALIFDEALARPGFDFNTAPLILAALELRDGLTLRFPHVRIAPPGFPVPEIAWATFVVEGREEVDAGPLGRVEAWRAVDPDHDMVFWLIDAAPHLVRLEFPIDATTLSVMELGAVESEGGGT